MRKGGEQIWRRGGGREEGEERWLEGREGEGRGEGGSEWRERKRE